MAQTLSCKYSIKKKRVASQPIVRGDTEVTEEDEMIPALERTLLHILLHYMILGDPELCLQVS